jgi:hypothetical protein
LKTDLVREDEGKSKLSIGDIGVASSEGGLSERGSESGDESRSEHLG